MPIFLIALIAAFAGLTFGCSLGLMSGAILFINNSFHLTALTNGMVMSMPLLGALFGAIFSGRLADKYGRKKMLYVDAITFIVGTGFSVFAPNLLILMLGRLLVGIGVGFASYIAPVYISEVVPKEKRGGLVSLNQFAITAGYLISYIVGLQFAHLEAWRSILAFGFFPAIILLIGISFIPKSPRWVLANLGAEKAKEILIQLRGCQVQANQELQEIQQSLQQQKGNWSMLFSKNVRPALVIAVGLAIFQQASGIDIIVSYAPTLFKSVGFHTAASAIASTVAMGVVLCFTTLIAIWLLDKAGRRPLLLTGMAIMTISMLGMSASFYLPDHTNVTKALILISTFSFIAGFAFSIGPIMWLMSSEVFPLKIRGVGASVATCANWICSWLVTLTFLSLIKMFGASTVFFIYAICDVLGLIFIYYFVPETKGCSLEKIETNLYSGKAARHLGS